MQDFKHKKKQDLILLLNKYNEIQKSLQLKSIDFEIKFFDFIDECIIVFKETGDVKNESEFLNFKSIVSSVKRGYDPIKLQKIESFRKEMFFNYATHILNKISEILNFQLTNVTHIIDDSFELLSNLILNLLQNEIINDNTFIRKNNFEKIQKFWNNIKQNDSVGLIEKKLKLKITAEDIILILMGIFDKIRNEKHSIHSTIDGAESVLF